MKSFLKGFASEANNDVLPSPRQMSNKKKSGQSTLFKGLESVNPDFDEQLKELSVDSSFSKKQISSPSLKPKIGIDSFKTENQTRKSLEKNENGKIITSKTLIYDLFQDFKTNIEGKDGKDKEGTTVLNSFSGFEGIELMLKRWDINDRIQAIEYGNKFLETADIDLLESGEPIFKDDPNVFYHILLKKDIVGMTIHDLFKEFTSFIEIKDKVDGRDGEHYYNCFYGNDSVKKMLENWDISRETAVDIGKKFIEEELIQICSAERSNAFKDAKYLYTILKFQESQLENMKILLEKFSAEYEPKLIPNYGYEEDKDYESFPSKSTKPTYLSLISDFTKAVQQEYVKYGAKRQWERDAKLWRTTMKYPGSVQKRDILRRIFTVLRFGAFFVLTNSGDCQFWYEIGLPIATALSHGSRVMIQTPPSYDPLSKIQIDRFWNWLLTGDKNGDSSKILSLELTGEECEKSKKQIFKRLAATHGISGGIRENLKSGYTKYIKEERTSGISISNANIFTNDSQFHTHPHWAMNIALGGHNLSTILGEKISANGEHGHLYIYHLPAEKNVGGILLGLEGSEFNKWDQVGHKHNINATSPMLSPTYGFKWSHNEKKKNDNHLPNDLSGLPNIPKRIDGMFIDLSQGFEYIEEMYSKWNDDWVMEPSLKPLPNEQYIKISKENDSEEKFEMIKSFEISPKEKVEMYKKFIRESNERIKNYERFILKEQRLQNSAEEKIALLSNTFNTSYEDLLLKVQQLQSEIESLKSTKKDQKE